jgi:hypothetical protein
MPYDPVFGYMGLLHADGSPKPQFTALVNLIHLLSDRGPSFTPTALQYSMSGDTRNVDHTLLQNAMVVTSFCFGLRFRRGCRITTPMERAIVSMFFRRTSP